MPAYASTLPNPRPTPPHADPHRYLYLSTIYDTRNFAINFANLSLCHISQYFPIPPIIASHQSSFYNHSSYLFLALLLPHLTVTLLPTILLPFWLFFSSFIHTLQLQFLQSFFSSLFYTLALQFLQPFLSLFDSLSPHLIFYLTLPLLFFQLFPSLLGSASPHYSTPYCNNSSNSSYLFFTLLLLIFIFFLFLFLFSINFVLLFLHLSLFH